MAESRSISGVMVNIFTTRGMEGSSVRIGDRTENGYVISVVSLTFRLRSGQLHLESEDKFILQSIL